jgi:ribose transport system substrate-binding protein
VLGIGVQPGISTTDARDKGFADAAKADSKYQYLGVQYSQNDPAKAAQEVSAALQKDPDIVGIFASNLFSAEGAATGIRQAGKQDSVKVVGFDAGPDQVKALQDGTVQALIAQQPGTIGTDGVQQAIKALKGEPTTKNIKTGFTIITKDNLNSPEGQAAAYKASC